MNYYRRGKRLVPLEESGPEQACPRPGTRRSGWTAVCVIDRLDPREQTIIRLRFFEDMKLEEIARITGTESEHGKIPPVQSLRRLRTAGGNHIEGSIGGGPTAVPGDPQSRRS